MGKAFVECCLHSLVSHNEKNSLSTILSGLCETKASLFVLEQCLRFQSDLDKDDSDLTKKYEAEKELWIRTYEIPNAMKSVSGNKLVILRTADPSNLQQSETVKVSLRNCTETVGTTKSHEDYIADGYKQLSQFWRSSDVYNYRYGYSNHITITISRFYIDYNKTEEIHPGYALVEIVTRAHENENVSDAIKTLAAFSKLLEPEIHIYNADLCTSESEYLSIKNFLQSSSSKLA